MVEKDDSLLVIDLWFYDEMNIPVSVTFKHDTSNLIS